MPIKPENIPSMESESYNFISTNSRPQGNQSSRQESGCHGEGQQAISNINTPAVICGDDDKDLCKAGQKSEMTTSAASVLPCKNLPKSELVTGVVERIPDEKIIRKQEMLEKEYSETQSRKLQEDCYMSDDSRPRFSVQESISQAGSSASSSDVSMLSLNTSTPSVRSGPQPTSASHVGESRPRIPPEEYPAKFKEQQYDCVLIYCDIERDRKMAINFKDLVMKHVVLEDGRPPEICVLDRNDNLTYVQSRFSHADEAMNRSTYMFLFITKDFVEDEWAEIQKDECLMNSIEEPDRKWCVVPLHTKSKKEQNFRYPYGLRALKGVDITVMLKGLDLADIDPQKTEKGEIDHFFLQNLTRMFNQRLDCKRRREVQQNMELELWIHAEEIRRIKVTIAEQIKKNQVQAQHDLEVKQMKEEAERMHDRLAMGKDLDNKPEPSTTSKQPLPNMLSNTLQLLQNMGLSFTDAVQMLHNQTQSGVASGTSLPTGSMPAGGIPAGIQAPSVVYNINNYGAMQAGSQNTQSVTGADTTDEVGVEDNTEYTVVDTAPLQSDAPPGGQRIAPDTEETAQFAPLRDDLQHATPVAPHVTKDTQGQGRITDTQGQGRVVENHPVENYSTPSQETQQGTSEAATQNRGMSAEAIQPTGGGGSGDGTSASNDYTTVNSLRSCSSSREQLESTRSFHLMSDPDQGHVGQDSGQGQVRGDCKDQGKTESLSLHLRSDGE